MNHDKKTKSAWKKFEGRFEKNPFPVIPRKKQIYGAPFLKNDCPLIDIRPLSNTEPLSDGILLHPGGIALGLVTIPKAMQNAFLLNVHARSTHARYGIDVALDQTQYRCLLGLHPLPNKLVVTISNWGIYPFLFRKNDTIALSTATTAMTYAGTLPDTAPHTRAYGQLLDLHAGNTHLEIVREKLPIFRAKTGKIIRVVDPHTENQSKFTRVHKFKKIVARIGDFLVITTKENIKIPAGHIGIVHAAKEGLMHTSATLVYPGWEGFLTLEFKAFRNMIIRPGMLVARLSTHYPPNSLPPYKGRYQNQKTPKPHE